MTEKQMEESKVKSLDRIANELKIIRKDLDQTIILLRGERKYHDIRKTEEATGLKELIEPDDSPVGIDEESR